MTRRSLHIAEPCHEDWSAMSGSERRRFCQQCTTHVHNLGELPRSDARALLASTPDPMCVRYPIAAQGGLRFATRKRAPSGPLRQLRGAARLTASAAAVSALLVGCVEASAFASATGAKQGRSDATAFVAPSAAGATVDALNADSSPPGISEDEGRPAPVFLAGGIAPAHFDSQTSAPNDATPGSTSDATDGAPGSLAAQEAAAADALEAFGLTLDDEVLDVECASAEGEGIVPVEVIKPEIRFEMLGRVAPQHLHRP